MHPGDFVNTEDLLRGETYAATSVRVPTADRIPVEPWVLGSATLVAHAHRRARARNGARKHSRPQQIKHRERLIKPAVATRARIYGARG